MKRLAALLVLAPLAACNPPAADEYVARVGVEGRAAPSPPNPSPDVEGAIWAAAPGKPMRLLYGKPGQAPLFALECGRREGVPVFTYTRFAAADPYAKAVLALIGNGHVSRLNIDATRSGDGWLWQGVEPAVSPKFEGFTGGRQVEATVAGAGSLILNPSRMPGELILACRALAVPAAPASAPAVIGAALPAPVMNAQDTTDTAAPPPPPAR